MTSRSLSFSNAVLFVEKTFTPWIEDGKFRERFVSPYHLIYHELTEPLRFGGVYLLSDEQTHEIVDLARVNAGVYDLALKICRSNLLFQRQLSDPLLSFIVDILDDTLKRPKAEKREKTWYFNLNKLLVVYLTALRFNLKHTRGDNNSPISACDAVVEGLARCGRHVGYREVKMLVVEKRFMRLRQEAELLISLVDQGSGLTRFSLN